VFPAELKSAERKMPIVIRLIEQLEQVFFFWKFHLFFVEFSFKYDSGTKLVINQFKKRRQTAIFVINSPYAIFEKVIK